MSEQNQYGIVIETFPTYVLPQGPRQVGAVPSLAEAMSKAEAILAQDPTISGVIVFSIASPADSAHRLSRSEWGKSGHDGWTPLPR